MDCPEQLKVLFPKYQRALTDLLTNDPAFRDTVADYRQIKQDLSCELARVEGARTAVVSDMSAAIKELQEDIRQALEKYRPRT